MMIHQPIPLLQIQKIHLQVAVDKKFKNPVLDRGFLFPENRVHKTGFVKNL